MRRALDWTAVLFPLLVSIAANTAWAARDGDLVAIVAGVVTPILLVLAVERWHAHGGLDGWKKWARLIAMTSVTLVTAAVSWVHITRLLIEHGWETPLAVVAPLGVDGLAVLGTLALWSAIDPVQGPVRSADLVRVDQIEGEASPVEASDHEGGAADRTEVEIEVPVQPVTDEADRGRTPAETDWTDEAIIADLRERDELGSVNQSTIRRRYGVGPTKAKRVLETLARPVLEAA